MASFYNKACRVDAKLALFQPELQVSVIDDGLKYYVAKSDNGGEDSERLELPHSIMNDNVAINYRTIYNGYPTFDVKGKNNFTEYDDYKKCISQDEFYNSYLQDKPPCKRLSRGARGRSVCGGAIRPTASAKGSPQAF